MAAVGGAGTVLASMEALGLAPRAAAAPFTPPARSDFELRGRKNDAKVLVLGAGVSGLVAAYELEKAGYRCELIEARARPGGRSFTVRGGSRSEEHTSELQSLRHLVCRLLLEKKKKRTKTVNTDYEQLPALIRT